MQAPQHQINTPASAWRTAAAVARKELTESLRDKQTVIYTVVLPLCLYPAMFWIMIQVALVIQGQKEQTVAVIGVAGQDSTQLPVDLPEALTHTPEGQDPPLHNRLDLSKGQAPLTDQGARAWLLGESDQDEEPPDAVLLLPVIGTQAREDATSRLFFDSTESRSKIAQKRTRTRLSEFVNDLREQAAENAGVDPRELDPIVIERENLAEEGSKGAVVLAMVLPLLMVVMTVMGSFFPAVDLTAGEKERGTAETTLLLPAPRRAVHLGKILAVSVLAVTATSLNLFALGLTAEQLLASIAGSAQLTVELPVSGLLSIAPLALLFAFFTSAVLTGIASLAATFKEGQALLGPVQMVFILPAMIGVIPGVELNPGWALVPVVNAVLAFRSLILGQPLFLEYALTGLSLLLYAALSMALAVRVLSRESVQMAGATLPLGRLFSILRGDGTAR